MTKLLDQAIEAVRLLPGDRQDEIGEMLLAIAETESASESLLTAEQVKGVMDAIADVDQNGPASLEEVRAVFGNRFG